MYVLEEQSDVFIDAAAVDHRSQLLFLSAYGRDTSIQQFMARLHQANREGGIERLGIKRPEGAHDWLLQEPSDQHAAALPASACALQAFVGDPRRLEKCTGRLPRGLLGNLVHAWIFDPALLEADHTSRSGWVFERIAGAPALAELGECDEVLTAHPRIADRCWHLVTQLSPVPLLETWRESLMSPGAATTGLSLTASRCVGPVCAVRVEIGESFARHVSDAVRFGVLCEDVTTLLGSRRCVPPTAPRFSNLQHVPT